MPTGRRNFIRNTSLATGGLLLMDSLKKVSAMSTQSPLLNKALHTITVFHTNDLHNQIHPFTNGGRAGYGGLKNIEGLVSNTENLSLLVDAGDFLGEHASFTEHREMIRNMNRMGYHAATIGNKELARGEDYLSELVREIKFRLVNCNYVFNNPILQKKVARYHIVSWGQYRIGITGIGTKPDPVGGNEKTVRFLHPYDKANEVARELKEKHCDLVICLSHLGYQKNSSGFNNTDFAHSSENIDLIISGHSNDLVAAPKSLRNRKKEEVILSHGGFGGLISRQISIGFNASGEKHFMDCRNFVPSANKDEAFYIGLQKIKA
jgi:5'-nucleotidase